jgi:glucosamine-6-phosphate deaminase
MWTLSCLQLHQHALIVCDEEAAEELRYGTVKYYKQADFSA